MVLLWALPYKADMAMKVAVSHDRNVTKFFKAKKIPLIEYEIMPLIMRNDAFFSDG